MGIVERKLREKEERRILILQKAKELVLEQGVTFLSMQEIADGVELSKATLYLYFQNKEAILTAILEEAAQTFEAFVRASIPAGATGLEAIHALWSAYLEFFGSSEDIFILTSIGGYVNPDFSWSSRAAGGGSENALDRILDLLAELLRRGMGDGSIDPSVDPEKTAGIVITVATSIIEQIARLPRKSRDLEASGDFLHDTFEVILRGIAARDAPRRLFTLAKP